MFSFKHTLFVLAFLVGSSCILPSASAAEYSLSITPATITSAETPMTLTWTLPPVESTGVDFYITGPSSFGTPSTPGSIRNLQNIGTIRVTPKNLTGNSNLPGGVYTLYFRNGGGNQVEYVSSVFTVTDGPLPAVGGEENPPIAENNCAADLLVWQGYCVNQAQLVVLLSDEVNRLQAQVQGQAQGPGQGQTPAVGAITLIFTKQNLLKNTIDVTVFYKNSPKLEFTLPLNTPARDINQAVANRLNLPLSEIESRIQFIAANRPNYKSIKLTVIKSDIMYYDAVGYDGQSQHEDILPANVVLFVAKFYRGDMLRYKREFKFYANKARVGGDLGIIYDLVAAIVNVPRDQVKDILTVDVRRYF